jgi:hypothetical protein
MRVGCQRRVKNVQYVVEALVEEAGSGIEKGVNDAFEKSSVLSVVLSVCSFYVIMSQVSFRRDIKWRVLPLPCVYRGPFCPLSNSAEDNRITYIFIY